jgi:hypothetical protein
MHIKNHSGSILYILPPTVIQDRLTTLNLMMTHVTTYTAAHTATRAIRGAGKKINGKNSKNSKPTVVTARSVTKYAWTMKTKLHRPHLAKRRNASEFASGNDGPLHVILSLKSPTNGIAGSHLLRMEARMSTSRIYHQVVVKMIIVDYVRENGVAAYFYGRYVSQLR